MTKHLRNPYLYITLISVAVNMTVNIYVCV